MVTITEEERNLETAFRKVLSNHELYREDHYVRAIILKGSVQFQYKRSPSMMESRGGTRVDLEIKGDTADIFQFDIEKGKRRQGHGRTLYEIIENFCREFGCKRIVTAPSGQGHHFWPEIGFKPSSGNMAEKRI
ncbi:MAG: GNAT family N-acetyltransferase [Myxococcales bacterium]|nr:GNAT family N-acetyltransferase [Myxococcales bacterium]